MMNEKRSEDKEASDSRQRLMERPLNRSIASYPPELLISIPIPSIAQHLQVFRSKAEP